MHLKCERVYWLKIKLNFCFTKILLFQWFYQMLCYVSWYLSIDHWWTPKIKFKFVNYIYELKMNLLKKKKLMHHNLFSFIHCEKITSGRVRTLLFIRPPSTRFPRFPLLQFSRNESIGRAAERYASSWFPALVVRRLRARENQKAAKYTG